MIRRRKKIRSKLQSRSKALRDEEANKERFE